MGKLEKFWKGKESGDNNKKDKGVLRQHIEETLKEKKKAEKSTIAQQHDGIQSIAPNNKTSDTQSITSSNETSDTGKEKVEERKKTTFELSEMKECMEQLHLIREELDALRREYVQPLKVRQEIFYNVAYQLKKFYKSGKYENTKQMGEGAVGMVKHVGNKISSEYRDKVEKGKDVRRLWRRIANTWLDYKNKFKNEMHPSKIDEKEGFEVPYPLWNNIEERKAYKASLDNKIPDTVLQKKIRLEQPEQNEEAKETPLLEPTKEQIQDAIKWLGYEIKKCQEEYEQAKEELKLVKDLKPDESFDVDTSKLRVKYYNELSSETALCTEVELRDLALGKAKQTLRLLEKLQSEPSSGVSPEVPLDTSSETSEDVSHELTQRVVDYCKLSVREYHEKYNGEIYRAAKYFEENFEKIEENLEEVKENFDIFQKTLEYFESENDFFSTITTDLAAREQIEHAHIITVFQQYEQLVEHLQEYKRLVEPLQQFLPEDSVQNFLAPPPEGKNIISLVNSYSDDYKKVRDGLEADAKPGLFSGKWNLEQEQKQKQKQEQEKNENERSQEQKQKQKQEVKFPLQNDGNLIKREKFQEKLLGHLLDVKKEAEKVSNVEKPSEAVRESILKALYGDGEFASEYMSYPFHDSEGKEDSISSVSNDNDNDNDGGVGSSSGGV